MTKDAVLALLWQNADRFLSGAALAERLSVSRTAVWKAVEQLRAEGYAVESATNRGYRLCSKRFLSGIFLDFLIIILCFLRDFRDSRSFRGFRNIRASS